MSAIDIKDILIKNGKYGFTSNGVDYDVFYTEEAYRDGGIYLVIVTASRKDFDEQSEKVLDIWSEIAHFEFENIDDAVSKFTSIIKNNGIAR